MKYQSWKKTKALIENNNIFIHAINWYKDIKERAYKYGNTF